MRQLARTCGPTASTVRSKTSLSFRTRWQAGSRERSTRNCWRPRWRVRRKAPADLDAYDCFLRATDQAQRWTDQSHEEALRLLYRAIELDPEYAQAYAFASYCYVWRWSVGHGSDAEQDEARRLAREAIKFGRDDGFSFSWGGSTLAVFARTSAEVKEGAAIVDQALLANPNLA